jgi:predicted transcriptional regulator
MATTTIRLPEDLKARIAALAARAGMTPHGFILHALAEQAEREERRIELDEIAESRYARIVESGETISWGEMRRYLEDHLAGRPATRPVPRKLAR